jgi:hypothetical protein
MRISPSDRIGGEELGSVDEDVECSTKGRIAPHEPILPSASQHLDGRRDP